MIFEVLEFLLFPLLKLSSGIDYFLLLLFVLLKALANGHEELELFLIFDFLFLVSLFFVLEGVDASPQDLDLVLFGVDFISNCVYFLFFAETN